MLRNYCTEDNNNTDRFLCRKEYEQEDMNYNITKKLRKNVSRNICKEIEDIHKETDTNLAIDEDNQEDVKQEGKKKKTKRKHRSKSPTIFCTRTHHELTAANRLESHDSLKISDKQGDSSKRIKIGENSKSKKYRKSGDKRSSESVNINSEMETDIDVQQCHPQVSYSKKERKKRKKKRKKAKEREGNSLDSNIPILRQEEINLNTNKCDSIKLRNVNNTGSVKPADSVECGAKLVKQKGKKNTFKMCIPEYVSTNRQEEYETEAKAVLVAEVLHSNIESQKEKKGTFKIVKQLGQLEVNLKKKKEDLKDIKVVKNKKDDMKMKLDDQGTLKRPINEQISDQKIQRPYKEDNKCSPVKKVKITIVDEQPESNSGMLLIWSIDCKFTHFMLHVIISSNILESTKPRKLIFLQECTLGWPFLIYSVKKF
jgi:hypothetical protein